MGEKQELVALKYKHTSKIIPGIFWFFHCMIGDFFPVASVKFVPFRVYLLSFVKVLNNNSWKLQRRRRRRYRAAFTPLITFELFLSIWVFNRTLIEKLENNKTDLQSKITKEVQSFPKDYREIMYQQILLHEAKWCLFQVKENSILQASLGRRKEELHERRLALEKEVRAQTMGKYFFSRNRTSR